MEAQRLGLESYASDLNPVAVTINKAMIEIPPKFAGRAPVGPKLAVDKQGKLSEDWSGARGLAEDVQRYGDWMRKEAAQRIGHLYPQVEVSAEMVAQRPELKQYLGEKLTVIAWIWARTVKVQTRPSAMRKCRLSAPLPSPVRRGKRHMCSLWLTETVTVSKCATENLPKV